jgi:hypothetical protein
MRILETLAQLDLQKDALTKNIHLKDATKACKRLLSTVEKLSEQASNVNLKPPLDPMQVWEFYVQANYDLDALDSRQIRTLCVSPATAVRTRLVKGVGAKPEILSRTGCLLGLINAYFLEWGSIDEQNALEKVIKTSLQAYQRKNPVVIHYQRRKDHLFSQASPALLGTSAIENQMPVAEALKLEFIPQNSKFGRSTLGAAIRAFISYFVKLDRSGNEPKCAEAANYAIQELLLDATPRDEFYAMIECFIQCGTSRNSEKFRHRVRDFVMQQPRLGDPRLPRNAAHWALVKLEARNAFLAWLAKDSIQFFFNYILPDNSENRRRKHFWLDYHDKVRDFQVALSDKDYHRLMAYAQRKEIPSFSRVNHQTTSAFLMRFGEETAGHYVVEFSETGNAAYIFNSRSFRTNVGDIRKDSFELVRELKHASRSDRIIHNGGWEWGARQLLATFGIR